MEIAEARMAADTEKRKWEMYKLAQSAVWLLAPFAGERELKVEDFIKLNDEEEAKADRNRKEEYQQLLAEFEIREEDIYNE